MSHKLYKVEEEEERRRRRRRRRKEPGVSDQKQKPHTKMWGKTSAKASVDSLHFWSSLPKC